MSILVFGMRMYNLFFLLYVFILIVSWMLCIFENKLKTRDKKLILLILIFILSSLMATRPEEIADTSNYIKIYNQVSGLNMKSFHIGKRFEGIEYSFAWLMKCFAYFFKTPRALFFFCSFFTCISIMYGLCICEKYISEDKEIHIFANWALFLCSCGLHYCGIAIRGGLSIGLGLCAIAFLLSNKRKTACFFMLAALSMHSISILFIGIYIIMFFFPAISKRTYLIVWTLLFVSLAFNLGRFWIGGLSQALLGILLQFGVQGFDSYLSFMDYEVGITDWYMLIVVGILLFCGFNKGKRSQKFEKVVFCGMVIISVAYPIRAVNRAYDYFLVFLIPLIANCFSKKEFEKKRMLIWIYMPLMFIVQFKMCYF